MSHLKRTWSDEVEEENRRVGQNIQHDCLQCQIIEATFAANEKELKQLDREWAAIQIKYEMMMKKSLAESPSSSSASNSSAFHTDSLWSQRLCSFHQPCLSNLSFSLNNSVPASSNSDSISHNLPLSQSPCPRPTPRLAPVTIASTWESLDNVTFSDSYILPDQSNGPVVKEDVANLPMVDTVKEEGNEISPTSSLSLSQSQSHPPATSSFSSTPVKRPKKYADQECLNYDSLPVSLIDDTGRRSSRVQNALFEAEREAELERKEKELKQTLRKEQERIAAEKAAIEQLKLGQSSTSSSSISSTPSSIQRSVASSLSNFGELLAMAAPDALLYHQHGYSWKSHLGCDSSNPASSLTPSLMSNLDICLRTLEVASFMGSSSHLSKMHRLHSTHAPKMTTSVLKHILHSNRRVDATAPFQQFREQLLKPDLLGLQPLHTLIRIGHLDGIEILLTLHDATDDELYPAHPSEDEIRQAPIDNKPVAPSSSHSSSSVSASTLSSSKGKAKSQSSDRKRPSKKVKVETNNQAATSSSTEVKLEDNASAATEDDKNNVMIVGTEVLPSSVGVSMEVDTPVKDDSLTASSPFPFLSSLPLPADPPMSEFIIHQRSPEELHELVQQRRVELNELTRMQLAAREDHTGRSLTPLLFALHTGTNDDQTYEIIAKLSEKGASILDTDNEGLDAFQICSIKSFSKCLSFLLAKLQPNEVEPLLSTTDDRGNTSLHYSLASALVSDCDGCTDCIRLVIRSIDSLSRSSPSPVIERHVPWSVMPPFVSDTLLRLQPLFHNKVLHALVQQTMWKGEVRIEPGIESKNEGIDQGDNSASTSSNACPSPSPSTSPSPSPPSSSPSPTPVPNSSTSNPSSTYLSSFFVSLLRLWRTLVHTDSKLLTHSTSSSSSSSRPLLSPLVLDLASLLPLGLFLEPPTIGVARAEEDRIALLRSPKCPRRLAALECAIELFKRVTHSGSTIWSIKNHHQLTLGDLLQQWPRHVIDDKSWYSQVCQRIVPYMPNAKISPPIPTFELNPNMNEVCATLKYIQPVAPSHNDAVSSIASPSAYSLPVRCITCGAGCGLSTLDPFHPYEPWSHPPCVCYSAPEFKTRHQSNAGLSTPDMLSDAQREKYIIRALNGVNPSSTLRSSSILPHTYSRCNIFANTELESDNLVGQPNTETLACQCKDVCTASQCPCSRHRFGSSDPISGTINHHTIRSTATSIFECQPLCACKCKTTTQ